MKFIGFNLNASSANVNEDVMSECPFESLPDEILNSLKAYFNSEDPKVLAEKIIQEGERSKSFLMVVPIQDWLGMGKEARINTPGTSSGNWQWRLRSMDLLKSLAPRIKKTIGDRAQ